MEKLTEDELSVLRRLESGDTICFSQDGDEAWFTGGDRAFLGREVVSLRDKGLTRRVVEDEENYRGMSERDIISDLGRAALEASNE